eukprot:Nitzschia sp. Nitz4//scaffold94_size78252//53792//59970//NITZ4_005474-RA/size78252-augustus-gene-0.67-mRNA-1//1//CDS//3329560398//5155//frame0
MGCNSSQPVQPDRAKATKGDDPQASTSRRYSFKRQDSGRSAMSNSTRNRPAVPASLPMNGTAQGLTNGNAVNHASDPNWNRLWKQYHSLLLDPADTHATLDSCMDQAINRLSAAEVNFLQRKVRSVIRSSNATVEKAKGFMRSGSVQDQEIKSISDKYHLLSCHVIRKILPKLKAPASLGSAEPVSLEGIDENVYLLCSFLHESLWDRVASIAKDSAEAAGMNMDVNHYQLPAEPPSPLPPHSDSYPDLPQGASLHSLTFLTALALRGTRQQRLQLLFYLLLPPTVLKAFLESHPAGGAPLWLLESGSDIVFSMASLSHYYWYDDTFEPGKAPRSQQTPATGGKVQDSEKLMLDGKRVATLIESIIMVPTPVSEGARTPIMSVVDSAVNGGKNPAGSPQKKSSKMKRRASNQALDEDVSLFTSQTEVMEKLQTQSYHLGDYTREDHATNEALAGVLKALAATGRVPISDFKSFCDVSIYDDVLDAIMNRLFAHTVFSSPSMELSLVRSRWLEWQECEGALFARSLHHTDSNSETLTQSVHRILSSDQSQESSEKKLKNTVFGGLGGFDGRGGLGYGVMYCVHKQWWDDWEDYVGWTWAGENGNERGSRKRRRPGPLTSEPLLNNLDDEVVAGTLGSYHLMMPGVKKGRDYVLIPPPVWDALYEIYSGGPPLPRMVLPPNRFGLAESNGSHPSSINGVPSEAELDRLASRENSSHIGIQKLPEQMDVETHPWVLHVHLCDPKQPYRRGEAGPMSIRVMTSPHQPFWRLINELVVRLPFKLYRAYGADGKGQTRLWKRVPPSGSKEAPMRFGPWVLLCKNRVAQLPKFPLISSDAEERMKELKDDWLAYADNATVEGIGLSNGNQIMVECATLNMHNDLMWPREQAATAGRVKHLVDKDMKFRQLLRGVDEKNEPLPIAPDLVGMKVDAADASGKWFLVEIAEVRVVAADTDDEEDSIENEDTPPSKSSGESKQVLVDFSGDGRHCEWIDVDVDRLASPGRYTQGSAEDLPDSPPKPTTAADGKQKPQSQVKKTETTETNGQLCTIPGYGACGLVNLGNTCYVNAAIQCVSYLPLLRSYLLSEQYRATGDLNKDNPLGTGGKLLEEFASLLKEMWSARLREKSPTRFRGTLGRTNEQFSGADQQDSQEFLSFILDVLHEDSNRVQRKPPVEGLEDIWVNKTSLPRVADEAWRRFLRRDRSIMADVGMGQVLNTVTCSECKFTSRNFDPFNLLSLPFPTVAEVLFRCTVVRRSNAYNTQWVLNKPRSGDKHKERFSRKSLTGTPKPPSDFNVEEEYVIAMTRLADSGDLKLQIQNITGIPAERLMVCRVDEVSSAEMKEESFFKKHTQLTLLTDKEAPTAQVGNRPRANSEDVSITPSAPTRIIAFEKTLRPRPIDMTASEEESSDSNGDEGDEEQLEKTRAGRKHLKALEKTIAAYGDAKECRLYDTDMTQIAKAVSRSLWPRGESDFRVGLRVDALDKKKNWCAGSIVEISQQHLNADDPVHQSVKTTVKVHFDGYAEKWDEEYTIEHFEKEEVTPLYSHVTPRKATKEFLVYHRFTDAASKKAGLFGQSFYMQCQNEWSIARAGAHILSQAARYLKHPPRTHSGNDLREQENIKKLHRFYDRIQNDMSDLIDMLVDYDRMYVQSALGVADTGSKTKGERFRNPEFDPQKLVDSFDEKINRLLLRLPFEVKVCTWNAPLGSNTTEPAFSFSLHHSICTYLQSTNGIVLHWRNAAEFERRSSSGSRSIVTSPVLYVHPRPVADAGNAELLKNANSKTKKAASSRGSAGLPLGVCFTEFCKQQQISSWRCPKCQAFRDGNQNMSLWRLPDLLTIHIKRFNCSARWNEKITTKVNFPLTGLDLAEWCHLESPVIQEDANGERSVYDLVGVLNHYGGMTGGHYVAVCKATACSREGSEEVSHDFNGPGISKPHFSEDPDLDAQTGWKFTRQKTDQNKILAAATSKAVGESSEPLWLQFDDDEVEPIPPRCVVSEMAYVLFYRRRQLTPSNMAKYSTLE